MEIEKVFFAGGFGQGFILQDKTKEESLLLKENINILDQVITPGNMTDLAGFFLKKIQFVGFLKEETNCMCFYLGCEQSLFETKYYYDCYYLITESRIFKKYGEHFGRDYNFIDNKWK